MAEIKQEMPPQGGYPPLTYCRLPMTGSWKLGTKIALLFAFSAGGLFLFRRSKDILNLEKIEMRCSRIAIRPMLEAEHDRALLKQLKKNRDYEEKIMKDVPGWEIGKWKNYPVYLTVGPDEFFRPNPHEFYAHNERAHYVDVSNLSYA